jgi:hypothetical protein
MAPDEATAATISRSNHEARHRGPEGQARLNAASRHGLLGVDGPPTPGDTSWPCPLQRNAISSL